MTLDSVIQLERRLAVRRTAILFGTFWLTYKAFDWAAHYALSGMETNGMEAAAIIAAVTAPITYLQKAIFDAYVKGKESE